MFALYRRVKASGVLRFVHPFYVLNTLTILTYVFARDVALNKGGMHKAIEERLLDWEKSCFASLLVLLAIKSMRATTMDGLLAEAFMYTKSVILLLALYIDLRLFSWYTMLMTVLFLMIPQPMFEGPEDIAYMTPATFDENVGKKGDAKSPNRWLVEFYAAWSPPCVHLEPVVAALSVKYSSPQLQFAKMDLGRWPNIAREFKVATSGFSKQLPTFIMFENGKEIGRIPHVFADGSVAKGRYRKADIIKAFDLENAGASLSADAAKKEAKKDANPKKSAKKTKDK